MSIEQGFVWMKIIQAAAPQIALEKAAQHSSASVESADRPPTNTGSILSGDRPPRLTVVSEETVVIGANADTKHEVKFTSSFKNKVAAETWMAEPNNGQKWKKGSLRCLLVEVSES